jgi:hypothetical protein
VLSKNIFGINKAIPKNNKSMRTSVLIVAAILGCAMCQTPAPTNKNFCNPSGTFCSLCKVPEKDTTNKSCETCGKNFVSTLVTGAVDTKECKAGTATNCVQASTVAGQCAACAANFALAIDAEGTAQNTCIADTTKITDCASYTKAKADTAAKCQACVAGKVLKDNTCTTAVSPTNCNVAVIILPATDQICAFCKSGFAAKKSTPTVCDQTVTGDLLGCQ